MTLTLVTGATGNVGSRLIKRLAARKLRVRAFVRKGVASALPPGVERFEGDLVDAGRVRVALEGVTKVFLLTAGTELTKLEANVIDAAAAAKVELLVKQSTQGAQYAGPLFAKWHRASEERIEAAKLPFTFLRPAAIATNALDWRGTIKNGGAVYGPYGNASLPVIDPDDIAAVAEHVLTTGGHAGKAYELTGPVSLTVPAQVAIVSQVLGKPVKYVDVPDEAARHSMLELGMPPALVEAVIDLAQALRKLGTIQPTGTVAQLLGRPPRTFQQFIEENVAAFR